MITYTSKSGVQRCKACEAEVSMTDNTEHVCNHQALYDASIKYRGMVEVVCDDAASDVIDSNEVETDDDEPVVLVHVSVINEARLMLGWQTIEVE